MNIMRDNADKICLQDSAVGFLLNAIMLYDKAWTLENKNLLESSKLKAPYSTNLLLSIELFLKVILLNEGHFLNKFKTHKIHDLYKKLTAATRNDIRLKIDHSGKHLDSLETALAFNNDKLIRLRYNDLTESSVLMFKYEDVLFHLALVLYEILGFKIKPDLIQYGAVVTRFLTN